MKIDVGDRVAYAAAFLKSAGIVSGALPFARGTVQAISQHGIATVHWSDARIPRKVLLANLWRADSLHLEPR